MTNMMTRYVASVLVSLVSAFPGQIPASKPASAPALADDPRVHWAEKSAVRVRTVDPRDEDFRDLQPLKAVIGNAQIVMLGEISHGDGTTMLAKSRLVKFLHQQMNFDVVVFESGLYDMSQSWKAIQQGKEPVEAVQRSLTPVWSHSPQVAELLHYVGRSARSSRPLALSGFDLQPSLLTRDMLLGELDAFAGRLGVTSEVTTPGSPLRELAENLTGFKYAQKGLPAPDAATRQQFYDDLELLRTRLAAAATAATRADVDYWRQIVLSSLKSYGELKWFDVDHGMAADPEWVSFNMRDKQNADNVMWLADHAYRGKKIIVWGATMHIVRNAGSIEATIDPKDPRRSYRGMVPMGAEVWRRAGSRMFSIGFTCYEGVNGIGAPGDEQGFRSPITSDQDPSIELEEILNAARFDYALLNFRKASGAGAWLTAPIVSRPLANQGMRAVWPNVLDAMFFIRVMQPNEATR